MKLVLLVVACIGVGAVQEQKNPLSTVMNLLSELTDKIVHDGEDEAAAYREYVEWCDDTNKNGGFAIETATNEKGKLEAKISELTSDIEVADSKVEDLAAAIATAEDELKKATTIRKKEVSDFVASEAELMESLDALSRTIDVLQKEMAKNPSLAQVDVSSTERVLEALTLVMNAASLPSTDKHTLLALVQAQDSAEDESMLGEPAAAAYKSHSGDIFDLLEDMKEKAEGELSDLRKAEVKTKHNYALLKQSLEDQMAADIKSKGEQSALREEASEEKAAAERDLEVTTKELEASKKQLSTARSTCMQVAADHEATVAARKEELEVVAKAKQILKDTSEGAVSQSYSFVELNSHTSSSDDVVSALRRLAKKQHSSALAQLASRVAAVARFGASNGEDPFAKIKGLIRDMITKLEKEAGEEATEKAYCDEQMAKTEAKKSDLEDDIEKMTSRIDKAASKSVQLKGEIKELEAELAALAKEQGEMDKIRADTHADYVQAKADLELGLSGVRKALTVLRDYYGQSESLLQDDSHMLLLAQQPAMPEKHSKSSGAGGGIIDILEVCESDFASNLAKEETEEADAQSDYEKVSQENAVTKSTKEQDVKYKSQEAKSMDATVAEFSADSESAKEELSAVLEYYSKIKQRCIAKPETYEERKKRREAEIQGLKEALTILKEESAFVQRKHHRRSFLGALRSD